MNEELDLRDVIDLLVTWGATADPGTAELLNLIAQQGLNDPRSLVRSILEAPGVALPDELQQDARALLNNKDAPVSQAAELAARMGQALRSAIAAQQKSVQDDVRQWGRLLEPSELSSILERIWKHESETEIADQINAARDLEEARSLAGKARWRIDDELRRALDESAGSALDKEALAAARATLDKANPDELAALGRKLARGRQGLSGSQESAGVDAVSQRVGALLTRARSFVDSNTDHDGAARQLLSWMVSGTESALEGSESGSEFLLQRLALWEQLLDGTLSALSERASPQPERKAVAQALVGEIRSAGAEDDEELQAAAKAIAGADPGESRAFIEAISRGTALLHNRRGAKRARLEKATAELRNAERPLEKELEQSAASLPAERIVEARLMLTGVELTVGDGDPTAVEASTEALREMTELLRQLSDVGQQHQEGRLAGERKRLRNEGTQLKRIADRGTGNKIKSLIKRIDDADGKALRAAAQELKKVSAQVGNALRLETGDVLLHQKKLGPKADERTEELKAAFEEDDLSTMAEAGRALGRKLKRSRRIKRGLMAVVAGGLLVGAYFAYQVQQDQGESVELRLATNDCQPLSLFDRGGEETVVDCDNGSLKKTTLKPGKYDVFVNQRFTGRVITVPGSAEQVLTDIPVPRPLKLN